LGKAQTLGGRGPIGLEGNGKVPSWGGKQNHFWAIADRTVKEEKGLGTAAGGGNQKRGDYCSLDWKGAA